MPNNKKFAAWSPSSAVLSTVVIGLLDLLLLGRHALVAASSVLVDEGRSGGDNAEDALFLYDNHGDAEVGSNVEPHPDPNDEHHEGMIYIGRWHHHHDDDEEERRRIGFDQDNGWRYVMGTSLDANYDELMAQIPEHDLHPHVEYDPQTGLPVAYHHPDFHHPTKTREQVLEERRHGDLSTFDGKPKRFGHVDTHPLDGGITPPAVVHVEPVFLDAAPVTNKDFAKFVQSTYYETEAEQFGWSFVLKTFLPQTEAADAEHEVDPEAEHWVAVTGAYWRAPEGPGSSYKYRESHPVTHVSHKDAAEYCTWKGKRLPGEREYEAAARAAHFGPHNRTTFAWGNESSHAHKFANLWGDAPFPHHNDAADGWRGTSPVQHYPPNAWGFYDTTGNVWEWMRGGKHKQRIVRGASYIDTANTSIRATEQQQHVATLAARATLHGTTTTGNVGFRCAKAPKRRVEHHYTWHDPDETGVVLEVEDQFGKRDQIPSRGWEDKFVVHEDDDVDDDDEEDLLDDKPRRRQKKKVVKVRERYSDEL